MLAGARGLNRGIERQEIGLVGYLADHIDDAGDIARDGLQAANALCGAGDGLGNAAHLLSGVLNDAAAVGRVFG